MTPLSITERGKPVEFEICERSGQLPWECGLAACENGCATKTVEFVPLATYRGAVDALRKYGGCLENCSALSGAPECSCGFDEAMLRAIGRTGGQS